jgi:hypothetical protein
MRVIAIAVHEDHGQRTQAHVVSLRQARARGRQVDRSDGLAMRIHALVDLDHVAVQQLRQQDVAIEQARAILVGDAQRIAEAARDGQRGRLAFALQQRVGSHRGAHLDRADLRHRNRLAPGDAHQLADAGDCRVGILFRILGQQLERAQPAIGLTRHDVGERTATIYPELPIHASLTNN